MPNLEPGFYTFGFVLDSNDDLQQSNDDDVWRWTGAEHQIAINESSYCDQLTVLTDNSGSFGDGSGNQNYVDNTYCQWLIAPSETAASITLTFESFETEFNYDYVQIYSGNSLLNTELAELDGNIGTTTVTANSSQMYIRFSSDYSSTDPGWTASYTSVPSRYCDGLTAFNASSGQINDGSFCLPYQDNLNCSWLIDPGVPNMQVLLDFEEFALVPNQDFLYLFRPSKLYIPRI